MSTGPSTGSFPALGTTIEVVVTDPDALDAACRLVKAQVQELDAAASRFRSDSELARLNAAGGRPVRVSRLLQEAMEDALRAAERTDGVVSPTVGEALELSGYDRDFGEIDPSGPAFRYLLRSVPGWRRVRIDRAARTITLPPGVHVDLGATAKAACADRAAHAAAAAARCGVLVNMGGDIAVAGPAPEVGWAIRVADRHDAPPGAPGVTVAITGGGLATSGTAARRWFRGGAVHHHLIDPATSAPAVTPWRTVTVVADSCLEANTASTASMILGHSAPAWLAGRGLHARLVDEDGRVVPVGEWPLDAVAPQCQEVTAS